MVEMAEEASRLCPAAEVSWGDALRGPFAALAAGDRAALETVWVVASRRLHALALWRTGNEEDAADVVQEVFVRLASRHADLGKVDDPHLWLLAVAHHAAIDTTRRRARRRTEPIERAGLLIARDGDPESAARAAELSRAICRLPDAQREAIALRHFGGLSFREIARITGVPTFTAASRCRLGLTRLRQLLGGSR